MDNVLQILPGAMLIFVVVFGGLLAILLIAAPFTLFFILGQIKYTNALLAQLINSLATAPQLSPPPAPKPRQDPRQSTPSAPKFRSL
jgi:hypothetical protein